MIDWLMGTWYGSKWDVTYEFILKPNNKWCIKDPYGELTSDAIIDASNSDEETIILLGEFVDFIIKKIDDKQMMYHQKAHQGLCGLTQAILFEKQSLVVKR